MKQHITLAILALTIITLVLTCPGRDDHMLAVKNGLTRIIDDKINSEQFGIFGTILIPMAIDRIVDHQIDVTNYVLFSTSSIYREDGNGTIAFGILGNVYFFDGKVREAFNRVDFDKILEK